MPAASGSSTSIAVVERASAWLDRRGPIPAGFGQPDVALQSLAPSVLSPVLATCRSVSSSPS
jgi:hypothetical protein